MPKFETRSAERFSVDSEGMRRIHAGRKPVSLIKEFIQNAFDEEITQCDVLVEYIPSRRQTKVVVQDDGPGYQNIIYAWVLSSETPKMRISTKRGRFNSGEKEAVSVAVEATIETAGWTVVFPVGGGREVKRNRRKSGTSVTAYMPWRRREANSLIDDLKVFRPTNCIYTVNGEIIEHQEPLAIHNTTLPTVIQDAPGEPLRPTRRKTDIRILQRALPDAATIYEMGIPVETVDLSYDVDVMQKVPLSPTRDTLSKAYLQDLYSEVLNAMHPKMTDRDFGESWVKMAVEDTRIEEEAVKSLVKNRYGSKVVMQSTDRASNQEAMDRGYELINPRSLSATERGHLRSLGGVESARDVFGKVTEDARYIDISNDPVKQDFASWVESLGRLVGLKVNVEFIYLKGSRGADCTSNISNPTIRFNTYNLKDDWFAQRGKDQLRLIIHEFGHAVLNGEMSHGPVWGNSCAEVGAGIALALDRQGVNGCHR